MKNIVAKTPHIRFRDKLETILYLGIYCVVFIKHQKIVGWPNYFLVDKMITRLHLGELYTYWEFLT